MRFIRGFGGDKCHLYASKSETAGLPTRTRHVGSHQFWRPRAVAWRGCDGFYRVFHPFCHGALVISSQWVSQWAGVHG